MLLKNSCAEISSEHKFYGSIGSLVNWLWGLSGGSGGEPHFAGSGSCLWWVFDTRCFAGRDALGLPLPKKVKACANSAGSESFFQKLFGL